MLKTFSGLLATLICLFGGRALAGTPKVRNERPRLFVRARAWDGPSVEKIKSWLDRPEYKYALKTVSTCRNPLKFQLLDDAQAGQKAIDYLAGLKVPRKAGSPSYSGIGTTEIALTYDWLRKHPDFTAEKRKPAIACLEWWGDHFKRYLNPGCVPFYSRNNGALSGLTAVGLALYGDSPKAQGYLDHAYKYLRENTGTIRQMEDGATGGASYGLMHQFTDNANIVAMWRSASDWDAAKWIKEKQGNWLERQLLYQTWFTYPNGWYWKEGDAWGGKCRLKDQYAMQVVAVTGMYRNGYGRTYLDKMFKWYKNSTFYKSNIWMFIVYNDPTIKPKPLSELGRGQAFSKDLHGYVSWRSSWDSDATCITFKAGDNVDHHGTWDTGKFEIFKSSPLAIKNGHYRKYKSSYHYYYKSPWSSNVVVFDGPNHGWQPGMPDLDGHTTWSDWKKKRDSLKHPVSGKLLLHEVKKDYARALADLSGSTYPSKSKWTREMVFLGYKYLLVLDRVVPGLNTRTRWLLQSIQQAKIDSGKQLAIIDKGTARLFVKTLLPEKARMENVGGGEKWFVHKDRKGRDKFFKPNKGKDYQVLGAGRLDVIPADQSAPCIYLHVLYPTDNKTTVMPACSVTSTDGGMLVKVGKLSYTFKEAK
jgi:hypothetical protein